MSDEALPEQACWHVVRTKPRQEFRALEQLQNQRYHCFLPIIKVEKIRRGKLETCIEPLFSRYLFIHLDRVTCNWSPIRSTRGVSELVAFGGRFATLPQACVEVLQSSPAPICEYRFQHGERVAITSGPFVGLEGIYQLSDGEARALVLIELMSQPQRLKFAVEMLRKVA
ncbi:transcription/translation regulatory transformer protein RfaH [Noviherbaspirillum cavernae]|uniref:Transcription/translation regulatory transformer protein RfaH n=1 Tax=Noviherbaspirillum cavernae TaxID=2320862 RepID=A0A418X045_9BURK|nr:transcription/translation regulatory transformer protein RfaH [Noviherbaspirillum cavernae]RJG05826.1 transcription/translation regulatory transformer protein RfaH [Noviherbaspirillum cavernae]